MLKQLQTNRLTFLGRYWHEHVTLSRLFASSHNLKILSFGCSTGEEAFLLKRLFPQATVFGCDVDWDALKRANALAGDQAIFFVSDQKKISEFGPFDIIICNSVLVSQTGSKVSSNPQLWLETLSLLDENLAPGGILQIINSNIPFRFHPCSNGYEKAQSNILLGCSFVDMFDLDSNHLCSGIGGVGWSCHLPQHKGEEYWHHLEPDDLDIIHWRKLGENHNVNTPQDEIIPNLAQTRIIASGTSTYSPQSLTDVDGPITFVEVATSWKALSVEAVRIEREHRRVWFDGSKLEPKTTIVDLMGSEATAFLESVSGRRSSSIALDGMLSPQANRSISF